MRRARSPPRPPPRAVARRGLAPRRRRHGPPPVFGGFADKSWQRRNVDVTKGHQGGFVASNHAFLFCLACTGDDAKLKGAHKLKLKGEKGDPWDHKYALNTGNGPSFGRGDLEIGSGPYTCAHACSQSDLGANYECPAGVFNDRACHDYLVKRAVVGSRAWYVEDYEVFVVSAV